MIKKLFIGNSALKVSRLCFGGEQLGGYNLGDYNLDETIEAAHKAIEYGVNFFDTADCYNLGESEKNISKIIKPYSRDELILSSKFGVRYDKIKKCIFYDNSKKWLDTALAGSLKRLKTDYIDLYQLHHWDQKTSLESIFENLEKKCKSGQIRYYGVSNLNDISKYLNDFPNLISFSNEYSLLNREFENNIDSNLSSGISFLAFGVLAQGLLSGKYDSNSKFKNNDRRSNPKYLNFHGEKLKNNLKFISKINKNFKNKPGYSLSNFSISWVLNKFNKSIIILGIKSKSQLEKNIIGFNHILSKKELSFLDKLL
tara:strand:- start:36 stop:974 length:939 start_codon:yes stop_codon:yes gene_type:complete